MGIFTSCWSCRSGVCGVSDTMLSFAEGRRTFLLREEGAQCQAVSGVYPENCAGELKKMGSA